MVLAVLAIITAYAVAGWREHFRKVRRGEAMSLLMQVAMRQEQFRLQAMRYADGPELDAAPPVGLGITSSGSDYLLATIAAADGYQATATAQTSGAQADDTHCWLFGIDSSGRRWAANRAGADTTLQCWQR
jgi:Tfp pilus assembly protein PilE